MRDSPTRYIRQVRRPTDHPEGSESACSISSCSRLAADVRCGPGAGPGHNRGAAVDLTLDDLSTGAPVSMVSGYDEFSPRAYPVYPGGTSRQRWYRSQLRHAMEAEGFTVYDAEWWHFDFAAWRRYPVGNER